MKKGNGQHGPRTKWFSIDRRRPLITGRVAGLNLQCQTQKSFFFTSEIKTTIFLLEFAVINYRWSLPKSFDDLKVFYKTLKSDDALIRGRDLLQAPFPAGNDGDTDVMLLVERREMIEAFIKELLMNVDYELYPPLAQFIEAKEHIVYLQRKVKSIVAFLRKLIARQALALVNLSPWSIEVNFTLFVSHRISSDSTARIS